MYKIILLIHLRNIGNLYNSLFQSFLLYKSMYFLVETQFILPLEYQRVKRQRKPLKINA